MNGKLTKVTDKNGKITEYHYDALNRLSETIRPNDTKTLYTYNVLDQIILIENKCSTCNNNISSYSYTYDAAGNITGETETKAMFGYVFDKHHNEWFNDWNNNGHNEKNNYGYGQFQNKQDAFDCKYINNIKFNTCFFFPSSYVKYMNCYVEIQYDGRHMHNRKEFIKTLTTVRSYEYNNANELTKCTETRNYNENQDCKSNIVYDYQYDNAGNRIQQTKTVNGKTVETLSYKYNNANQLISKETKQGCRIEKVVYKYDKNGNLISESGRNTDISYQYTIENRLKAVYDKKELLMAASYDGDGNKIFQLDYNPDSYWKNNTKWNHDKDFKIPGSHWSCDDDDDSVAGSDRASEAEASITSLINNRGQAHNYELTEYINDVNRENTEVLMEYDQNGCSTAYTYGVQRLSVATEYTTNYYLYDGRGSVTSLTNMRGNVSESYSYDPFGALTSPTKTYGDIYAYNGEAYNTNIGLEYLRARYYDTSTGRFISEDSVLGDITQPLTLNRYAYTSNNPVNYMDPSGHSLMGILKGVKSAANSVKDFVVDNRGAIIGTAIGVLAAAVIVIAAPVSLPTLALLAVGVGVSAIGTGIGGYCDTERKDNDIRNEKSSTQEDLDEHTRIINEAVSGDMSNAQNLPEWDYNKSNEENIANIKLQQIKLSENYKKLCETEEKIAQQAYFYKSLERIGWGLTATALAPVAATVAVAGTMGTAFAATAIGEGLITGATLAMSVSGVTGVVTAVNDAAEADTGANVIVDTVFNGDDETYRTVENVVDNVNVITTFIGIDGLQGQTNAKEENIAQKANSSTGTEANAFEGGSKSDVLAQNRANGRAFEQQEFANFSSQNNNAVEQITVKIPSGVRTRVDAIGLDANGNVVINEYKSSLTAPLTNNQKMAFPEIYESGATVV